jgi:hypothetical protein
MVSRAKTEKVSVTIPARLVKEIRSITSPGEVSAFFTDALEYYLAVNKQAKALEKAFGAWKDEDYPELKTPEDATAYVNAFRALDEEREKRLGDSFVK